MDRDAGLAVAGQDRCGHGARAAPARQQRRMEVERADRRQLQDRVGDELAVGGHEDQIGSQRAHRLARLGRAQADRLEDGDAPRQRDLLHGRRRQAPPTARGLVRLADQPDDIIAPVEQRLQRRPAEVRGAHQNDAHGSSGIGCVQRGATPRHISTPCRYNSPPYRAASCR
ncbi:MAG: hypothetical protein MUC51_19015, partial [Anaerolineae bacterium]|nr:hypothetical protein [Anaerolineae bacterium]